jgi:hypothetical protein
MPVTDFTDPPPPTVLVYADDADMNPIRTASWPERARAASVPIAYDLGALEFHRGSIETPPIKLRAGRQVHGTEIIGGIICHHPTSEPTWSQWHENVGLVSEVSVTIIGTRFHSLGDGVSLPGGPWRLIGCRFTDIYDDAVENDGKHSGLVDSCVLDGVHIAFSAESGAVAQPDAVLRITNTMVRLRPQRESYKPLTYGYGQHGPFFKWDPDSPKVDVRDSIFRADSRPSYNRTLRLPPGSSGSNVMLIGTEAWRDDEIESWTSQVDGVTFGSAEDWENAIAHRATWP